MPERRLPERHKFITYDNQQFPWKLLNRIQDCVCATYGLRSNRVAYVQETKCAHGYSDCCATIPPTAPINGQDHLLEVAVAFFRS